MHLGTWYWESNLCKWCCSRLYKRAGKGRQAVVGVSLGFHSRLNAAQRWVGCAIQMSGAQGRWPLTGVFVSLHRETGIQTRKPPWTIIEKMESESYMDQRTSQCERSSLKAKFYIFEEHHLWIIISLEYQPFANWTFSNHFQIHHTFEISSPSAPFIYGSDSYCRDLGRPTLIGSISPLVWCVGLNTGLGLDQMARGRERSP